jgi:DNA polymerase
MIECHCDFETRSDIDIKTRGSYIYFESSLTEPLCASFKFTGAHYVYRWLPSEPCPPMIVRHAQMSGRFVAHNAGSFEAMLWETVLVPRYGWPRIGLDQWRCTMAAASALGLPASLEKLGEALDLNAKKDKAGKSLIVFFCSPRRLRSGEAGIRFNEPADYPEKFEQFRAYCDDDVRAESEADARMIPLSDDELAVWRLSEAINRRGVRVDTVSARAALRLIEQEKLRLDAEITAATGSAVTACSQAARLTAWLASQGVAMEGVAKDDVLEAFELDDLPKHVRKALEIRQQAAKPSINKLKAFLAHVCADDRVRGTFVYHGTGPGRWTSAGGVNFYNMPRPRPAFDDADLDPATLFAAFRSEEPAILRALYGDDLGKPTHLVSDAIRSFLIAAPGKDFIAVDYSGIQGALCAWYADEKWKLQAMREIIADPRLPDLYRRTAASILNTTTEVVTKKHWGRQIGKVAELALGFQGSVAALVSMAANYDMLRRNLHDLYPGVWGAADEAARERAIKRWEQRMKSRDRQKTDILTREAWLACMIVVNAWRRHNAEIKASWSELEDAARRALREPGVKQRALDRIDYLYKSGFLWCRLPSGRPIAYAKPRLRDQAWAKLRLVDGSWGEAEVIDRDEAEKLALADKAQIQGATSPKVTALGYDSTTKKMLRYGLYGGLLMENNCLGAEADVLRVAMRKCEDAGYPIVLHIYDEAVAEVPRGFGSVEEMKSLMLDLPVWTRGLPLTAHGYRAKRYAKK